MELRGRFFGSAHESGSDPGGGRTLRKMKKNKKRFVRSLFVCSLAAVMAFSLAACGSSSNSGSSSESSASSESYTITNVSYDPTREFYEAYNKLFTKHYKKETGKTVDVVMSHGGSGTQARSVVEGADADVVTLALAHDITLIQENGLINDGWENEFAKDSSPYTSTIVFLVRKGNPKNIKDWDDLVKDGVDIITPDPKSSGGACWNFLAAWNYASEKYNNNESKTKSFVKKLYSNVSVMDSGARGATTTFVENGQGDVLIAWENEALQTVEEHPDEYEIISPSVSILAQPSVAIVDENADKDKTQKISKDYLQYLYSDKAQKLIGKYGYRPSNKKILKQYSDKFDLDMDLCSISDFGGWDAAYKKFFNDGGIFDEIYNS